ncbi:MAG TPA: TlpA family protein disulfide reductase [Phaeodactylibacter sp.]|nr:TlpA family protein disulfide reductase [Phaeodactylibacter sp.]
MRILIYLFVIALFLSCKNNATPKSSMTAEANAAGAFVKKTPAVTVAKRDTTPVPRRRYAIDTSRPKNEIKSTYPFDISMTNDQRKVVNSEDILAKNGKPTVVLFWLTTCYPCRMELDAIKRVYPQWKKEADFNFVVISTDFQKNYENFIKRVKKENWEWTTYHDTNREFRKVLPGALNGLPQSFIFDKNGKIVFHKRKFSSGDEHKLFAEVKKLIEKG